MLCSQCKILEVFEKPADQVVSTCNHTRFDSWCDSCFTARTLNDIFPQCTVAEKEALAATIAERKERSDMRRKARELFSRIGKLKRKNKGGFDHSFGADKEETDLLELEVSELSKRQALQLADTERQRQQLESVYDYIDD